MVKSNSRQFDNDFKHKSLLMTFIIGTFANSLWNVGRCSLRSMLQVPPSRLRLAWVQTLIQMDPNMDMKWCEYHNVLWFMMTVINDPSMANVLSVPAAKPHLQQSQNYAQMHIDAANNNTSCQVYFEINSVLRHWWLRPRANWKTFSMYHHLLAFPIDIFLDRI